MTKLTSVNTRSFNLGFSVLKDPLMVLSSSLESKLNWLYFDINSYFATIEQQVTPELRNKPIVVVPLISDSTCAIAVSHEAKLKGIKTGTKIYEARKLCPELICVPARHELYVSYHKQILKEIDKYIYLDHVFSIDEGAGRLTGEQCNESFAIAIAHKIKEGIKNNVGDYIRCSIGIAPNRFLAKIATGMQKPDGLIVIRPEDIPQKLFALKLRSIPGIGPKVFERLNSFGIDSVEKLYQQDFRALKVAWGSIMGEKCWHLLRGADLALEETTKTTIGHSKVLAPEQRGVAVARDIALTLLLKAAVRIRAKNLTTSAIELSITTSNNTILKTRTKVIASSDSHTLSQALLKAFDKLIEANKVTLIKKISINLNGLAGESPQLTFADLQANKINLKKQKLSDSVDALNKRFNKNIVSLGLLPKGSQKPNIIAFGYIP